MKIETFIQLIEALKYQTEVERKVNDALKDVFPDNYILSLVSEKLDKAIHRVLYDEYDEEVLNWWLYEDVDKFIYFPDGEEVMKDLTDIGDLWEYLNRMEGEK